MSLKKENYMGILSSLLYLRSEVALSDLSSTHEQLKICCYSFFEDLTKQVSENDLDLECMEMLIRSIDNMDTNERTDLCNAIEKITPINDNRV